MKTDWMLAARYEGLPVIPAERVCKDYFAPLTLPKFLRKIAEGAIKLPLVRMEDSQKAAKGVHVRDLAAYIDERREAAQREYNKLHG